MIQRNPKPLEEVDPELGTFLQEVSQGKRPHNIVGVHQIGNEIYFKEGPIPGRNDRCFCGSKRKYKKCCGKQ